MNRATKIVLGIVVAVLFLFAATYGWRAYANGRKLDQLQVKAQEAFSQPPAAGGERGRFEGFREIRGEVEALPESYQQQFRQSMGNMFQQREEKRYDDYFKLTKLERKKHLDKKITEDEKRRKEWQARRTQRDSQRAQGGPANGGTAGGRGGPGGPGGPPNGGRGGGGPGRWGGGGLSARLDSTSPEFRAKRTEYRRDMEQRRKELGLPADPRGR